MAVYIDVVHEISEVDAADITVFYNYSAASVGATAFSRMEI